MSRKLATVAVLSIRLRRFLNQNLNSKDLYQVYVDVLYNFKIHIMIYVNIYIVSTVELHKAELYVGKVTFS